MSIFSSKRFLTWSEAALSLIPGSGILILISITEQTLFNEPQGLLSLLQGPLAIAFGAIFFAPAWRRLPIKVEGQFLEWRYSGRGARVLSIFRNGMLTFVVAPLLMALIIVSVVDWPTLHITERSLFISGAVLLLIVLSFLNSIRQRIKTDIAIGWLTLAMTFTYAVVAIFGDTSASNIWAERILPVLSQISTTDIILSSCVIWWFSGIVDMPDMRAQKLLATHQNWSFWNPVAIAAIIIVGVQGLFLAFPPSTNEAHWLQLTIIGLLLLNALTALLDLQHWAGGAFIESVVQPTFREGIKNKAFAIAVMISTTLIAYAFACWFENASRIVLQLLSFSAGVGPVYILRWTWYRINAWTQFSAMLGAMIIGLLWPGLIDAFHIADWSQSFFLVYIILPGALNCFVWILVLKFTEDGTSHFSAKRKIAIAGVLNDFRKIKKWARFIGLSVVLFLALYWSVLKLLVRF